MLHLPSLACGSAGIIGGGANLYPGLLACRTEAFNKDEITEAIKLQQQVRDNWVELNKYKSFRWICKQIWQGKGVINMVNCGGSNYGALFLRNLGEMNVFRKMHNI